MRLKIIVHPRSKNPRVEEDLVGELHVYVQQVPQKGEANRAVIGILAKHFQTSKSKINITAGFRSKRKSVEILT